MDDSIVGRKREVLLKAIETIGTIEGSNDGDTACIRCSQRMIAEVLGLPLGPFRLMMEAGTPTPLFLLTKD